MRSVNAILLSAFVIMAAPAAAQEPTEAEFTDLVRRYVTNEKYDSKLRRKLQAVKRQVIAKVKSAPPRNGTRNLAKRFREHGNAYFTFITTPGVEPTNNLAE